MGQQLLIADPEYSDDFVLLGISERLLVVVHCAAATSASSPPVGPRATNNTRHSYEKRIRFQSSKKNPYAKQLKRVITIRVDEDSIAYFKQLAEETGMPYQALINLFLKDCVQNRRKPDIKWA